MRTFLLAWMFVLVLSPSFVRADAQAVDDAEHDVLVLLPVERREEMLLALRLELARPGTFRSEDLVANEPSVARLARVRGRSESLTIWVEFERGLLAPPTLWLFHRESGEARSAVLPSAYDVLEPRVLALFAHSLLDAPPARQDVPRDPEPALPEQSTTEAPAPEAAAVAAPVPERRRIRAPRYDTVDVSLFFGAGLGYGSLALNRSSLVIDGRLGARVHASPRLSIDAELLVTMPTALQNNGGILGARVAAVALTSATAPLSFVFKGGFLGGVVLSQPSAERTRSGGFGGLSLGAGLHIRVSDEIAIEAIAEGLAFFGEIATGGAVVGDLTLLWRL